MAYPPHYLLQFGGTLHATEEWANNIRFVHNTGSDPDENAWEAVADDLQADLTAFIGSSLFHTGVSLDYLKFNRIGPDGLYASSTVSNTRFLSTPVKGTGTTCFPAQVAIAASFETGVARGYASRGRIFLAGVNPGSIAPSTVDGRMSEGGAALFRDGVATLLTNLNNWPGLDASWGGLDASIVSNGGASGSGVARKITGVKVGRVYDTQRRRRVSLAEAYSPVAAVA